LTDHAIRTITANGISFACLEQGKGPLVLCLHGFPDTAFGFEETLPHLAGAGYHAVAPFMRGYHPTGLAPDGNYSVLRLADDILALTTSLGHDHVSVIGHDWGAFAAYTAANLHPGRIDRLVLLCVPHMHATHLTLSQLRKSQKVQSFLEPKFV
jgi:pimeloyl-ACP methyl ester carboxylesterase